MFNYIVVKCRDIGSILVELDSLKLFDLVNQTKRPLMIKIEEKCVILMSCDAPNTPISLLFSHVYLSLSNHLLVFVVYLCYYNNYYYEAVLVGAAVPSSDCRVMIGHTTPAHHFSTTPLQYVALLTSAPLLIWRGFLPSKRAMLCRCM